MKDKKKIIKVLQIIYDIISAVFIVFVCVAMAITPKVDNSHGEAKENNTALVERKERSNLITGSTRTLSMSNDFISSSFMTTMVSVSSLVDDYMDDNTKTTKRIYVGEGYDGQVPRYPRVQSWTKINYETLDTTGTNYVDWWYIESISLNITGSSTAYGLNFFYLHFAFCDELEDELVSWNCILFNKGKYFLPNSSLFSFSNFSVSVNQENSNLPDGNFVVVYSVEKSLDHYMNAYYNDSFATGYKAGERAGYDKGYVDGSNGVETNAFTAITQAFEAMGAIFNINVLPNLPLWVLVFAPVIVGAIIVIVKMIKG